MDNIIWRYQKPLREKFLVPYSKTLKENGYKLAGNNTWIKDGYRAIMWPKKKYRRN